LDSEDEASNLAASEGLTLETPPVDETELLAVVVPVLSGADVCSKVRQALIESTILAADDKATIPQLSPKEESI
jgi:hypothetical protein